MKTKVIATLLIYCFIFQIPFIGTGCTSFYPVEGSKNLYNYKNYEGNILIKIKDGTEIEIPQHGIFYIEQDKIDSSKIVEYHSDFYQQYWTKDLKKLTFKLGKSPNLNSDTTSNFYLVLGADKAFKQIYDNDIEEIQIRKPDNTKTTILFVALIVLVITGLAISQNTSWDLPPVKMPNYY